MRTSDYIRVEVFEDSVSVGVFWQSPDLIQKNQKTFGVESYLNINEHKSLMVKGQK